MFKAVTRTTVAVGSAAVLLTTVTGCASSDSGFAADAGQTSSTSTQQAPIVTWYRVVGPLISTAEQSITSAQWAVRRARHRGLSAACTRISTDVAAVRAAPAAPDAQARTALALAMRAFDTAADQCLDGDLDAAGRSVTVGHRHAEVAGKRVVALLHAAS